MEKIIYVTGVSKKDAKQSRIRQAIGNIAGLPYPVSRKEGTVLGFPITEYRIEGISEREAARLEAKEREDEGGRKQKRGKRPAARRFVRVSGRSACRSRFNRTLKKIKRQIQKKEMQEMTGLSGKAFLFCGWRECRYPVELMTAFYKSCYRENMFVFRAEQLIFLDGREEDEDALMQGLASPELTFMSEIYNTYNYATIVTEREEFWKAFTETAYEEYGLSVRCVKDAGNLAFREKKTLVVDLGSREKECCRNLPPDSVYMDLRESRDKSRRISEKCGEIPYLSLRNVLDTVRKDTV